MLFTLKGAKISLKNTTKKTAKNHVVGMQIFDFSGVYK